MMDFVIGFAVGMFLGQLLSFGVMWVSGGLK